MDNMPLTVTELTARIKQVLEQGFAQVEVTGEISRLTHPSSGHLYFTIKDAHAAISAVVWRTAATRLKTKPKDGQAYVFSGHLSLYEPRGSYQLVVTRIEAVGAGRLAAEFERRKQAFAQAGWFDAAHKKSIPALPQHIGIVTSATAAAFADVKKVLATRPTWLRITLSPCLVQGEAAPTSVATAIHRLNQLADKPDVILLVRGGGSIEDLWCFNDETIIKAVFESKIPVISGIGHEIDTTLTDLAADVRAATPSNAAEMACPSRETLRPQVQRLAKQLQQAISRYQDDKNWSLERTSHKIQHLLREQLQQKHSLIRHLKAALQQHEPNQLLRHDMQQFYTLKQQLLATTQNTLQKRKPRLNQHQYQLQVSAQSQLQDKKQQWQKRHEQLFAMNPQHVLKRGYAMTTDQHGQIISSSQKLQKNDVLQLHFHDGVAQTKVVTIKAER